MGKEKQCYICHRTEQEVKTLLEKLSPEIPLLAAETEDAIMVSAKTELFRDELKGIYRCVICESLLMDMAEDTVNRRIQEDLITEDDFERVGFEISAYIEPKENEEGY